MVDAVLSILSPLVGDNCLFMGCDELKTLLELDEEHLRVNDYRLKWYFGQKDGWVQACMRTVHARCLMSSCR